MPRRIIAALSVVTIIVLFGFLALFNPSTSASPQELTVISRTKGNEVLTAVVLDNDVKIRLKNNHNDTITAFAIKFSDTTITEDFAYSDVHFGIQPGDTFEKSYPASSSPIGSEGRAPLYLLTVLLKDGTSDGDLKEAREIKDERLGEKTQILKTLRILEKEGQSRKDLKTTKKEIADALDSDEAATRSILNELEPSGRMNNTLSNALMSGLQVGREKMLRRFEVLEQLPPQDREQGFIEFKERSRKLFAKL